MNLSSSPIRLILFDIDGTLLVPRGVGRAASQLAMREVFSAEINLDAHEFGGKTDWHTLIEVLAEHGRSSEEIGQLMPLYEDTIARHLSAIIHRFPVEACPGALELVEALRRKRTALLGLVTGNVSTTAPIKLLAAGFDPAWFPVGAYGSESPDRNDLPALALARAERLTGTTIRPDETMVIGDTPADVACARALGAVAVVVTTGFATREELVAARPDYLLEDLTHFLEQVPL